MQWEVAAQEIAVRLDGAVSLVLLSARATTKAVAEQTRLSLSVPAATRRSPLAQHPESEERGCPGCPAKLLALISKSPNSTQLLEGEVLPSPGVRSNPHEKVDRSGEEEQPQKPRAALPGGAQLGKQLPSASTPSTS